MKIFIYIVGIITTIIIIIITLPNIIITRSEPYRYSLSLLQKNTDVKVYLGDNYSHVGLARGSIRYSSKSNSGFANISYRLKGQNGVFLVHVAAEKKHGIWEYKKITFYTNLERNKFIDLLKSF